MKRRNILRCCKVIGGLLFLLFFSVSCKSEKEYPLLNTADSLMSIRPDSALKLLETTTLPTLKTPAERAKYALLLTQAHDKNYVIHTSDSLIKIALDYYDTSDNLQLKAKAHYYMGRVYQDMGNGPATAYEFLRTIEIAEKKKGMEELLYLAKGNLGYLYYMQGLNDKADCLYRETEVLAIQHNDSFRLSTILANRGSNFLAKGDKYYTNAELLLKRALDIAERINNKDAEWQAVSFLGKLYNFKEKGELAVDFAKRDVALSIGDGYFASYLSLGYAYSIINQLDSAREYLYKASFAKCYMTKSSAYEGLANIAKKANDLSETVKMNELCALYTDSVKYQQQQLDIIEAAQKVKLEEHIEKYSHSLRNYNWHIVTLLLVLISLSLFYYFRQRRLYKDKQADEIRNKELLDKLTKVQEDLKRMYESELKNSTVYKKMNRMIANYKRTDDCQECIEQADWDLLLEHMRKIDGFPDCLLDIYPDIIDTDLRLCCLMRLGLPVIDIGILMKRTRDTIYKRVTAIRSKLDGYPKDLTLREILEKM